MSDLVLSLDPSSTRSGWAVMSPPERLIQAGLLLPEKTRAANEARIDTMCGDLPELLDEWKPAVVVIEWTSGKVNIKRHKGAGAGLAVHGAATGALWREAEAWKRSLPADRQSRTMIALVRENEWTRGISKANRQAAVAANFPAYAVDQDPGADIADAIGLGSWWLRERMAKMLKGAAS